MKKPRFMNMDELLALPVLVGEAAHRDTTSAPVDTLRGAASFGGHFRDRDGVLWGTCFLRDGWARYPAALALYAA